MKNVLTCWNSPRKKWHCIHQGRNFQEKGKSSKIKFWRSSREAIVVQSSSVGKFVLLPQRPGSQEVPSSSLSSENKMSSTSSSSKPRNVEASLSDALPNNSSRALSFLPSFFALPLPSSSYWHALNFAWSLYSPFFP